VPQSPSRRSGASKTPPPPPDGWGLLPHNVDWVTEACTSAKPKNKFIRFSLIEDVAGTAGVFYYSAFFPIEEGATYRFQCRWRTTGPAAKVFIKCYDELPTSFRTNPDAEPLKTEKREVCRNQQNLQGSPTTGLLRPKVSLPGTPSTPRAGDE
jgi:hypothetical protein